MPLWSSDGLMDGVSHGPVSEHGNSADLPPAQNTVDQFPGVRQVCAALAKRQLVHGGDETANGGVLRSHCRD